MQIMQLIHYLHIIQPVHLMQLINVDDQSVQCNAVSAGDSLSWSVHAYNSASSINAANSLDAQFMHSSTVYAAYSLSSISAI